MRISFHYANGTSTLVLVAESERDKTHIKLFREGRDLKYSASSEAGPEGLAISSEIQKEKAEVLDASR